MTYTYKLAKRLSLSHASVVVPSLLLAVAACSGGNSAPTDAIPTESPTPIVDSNSTPDTPTPGTGAPDTLSAPAEFATTAAPTCSNFAAARVVNVSNASQLSSALSNARPGDRIQLANVKFSGRWTITKSGTASQPIILCGTRSAELNGGNVSSGSGLYVKASRWILAGFSVTNSQKGIYVLGGSYNRIDGVAIHDVGQEAIHIRGFSKYNTVRNSQIWNTGRYQPGWGEGIYIGTANTQWCTYSSCGPDKSDYNTVTNNVVGPGIGAQMVDVKEGTSYTVVSGNTFDGRSASSAQDGWVNVYGSDSKITGNKGTTARQNGYKVESLKSGWGLRNYFQGNISDLAGGSGYGFKIGGTPSSSTVIKCDNKVTNARSGFATIKCQP